jgi:hypothetical protein
LAASFLSLGGFVVTRGFFFGGFLLGCFALVHSVQLLSARCRTGGCYFSAPWRDYGV